MSAAPFNAIELLASVVQDVADDLPDLIAGSTAADLSDLAAPYAVLSDAVGALRGLLDTLSDAIAHEMTGDQVAGKRYRIDRRRTNNRKQWDYESVRRDYVRHVQRSLGVLGGQVVSAEGEVLEVTAGQLMAEAMALYGSSPPRVGALRAAGLDPADYAETTRGRTQVTVTRLAVEEVPA